MGNPAENIVTSEATPAPAPTPTAAAPKVNLLLTFATGHKEATKPSLEASIEEARGERRASAVTELAGVVNKAADKAILLNNRIKGVRPKPLGVDATTGKTVEGTLLTAEQAKELKQLKEDLEKGEKAYAKAQNGDFEDLKKWASATAQGKDAPAPTATDSVSES